MWRKVLNIASWCILAAYLGFSLWLTGQHLSQLTFRGVVVTIPDSLESHFVTPAEITGELAKQGIRITGNKLDDLNRDQVKKTVKSLSGVKDVLIYSTPGGVLFIRVWQRVPVLRYIGPTTSYYIDNEGKVMELSQKYSARVLMVTGSGDKKFIKDSLFPVAMTVRSQAFLDALIGEIAINPDHTLEIVPRVGDQRIFFGDASDHVWKLEKLKVFYEKGLPNVGWDRYSRIDLRYSNQVVARKWNDADRQVRDSVRALADTTGIKKPQKKV